MIHNIRTVAEHRLFDLDIANEVAAKSKNVHSIGGELFVSTWSADAFAAEVRAAQGDDAANEAIRQREIKRLYGGE